MKHSILVCTIACVLIGLFSASILYAPELRIERRYDFQREARERLEKVPGLTDRQHEEMMNNPRWIEQSAFNSRARAMKSSAKEEIMRTYCPFLQSHSRPCFFPRHRETAATERRVS